MRARQDSDSFKSRKDSHNFKMSPHVSSSFDTGSEGVSQPKTSKAKKS